MKHLIVLAILVLLCAKNSYAQSQIHVSTYSTYFDSEDRAYKGRRIDIDNGTVYFFDEHNKVWHKIQITNSHIDLPHSLIGQDVQVFLCHEGKYYYTQPFRMNTIVTEAPFWIFQIEESSYSKEIFHMYYFALSIPPFECGTFSYTNRWRYHHRGRKLCKTMRKFVCITL